MDVVIIFPPESAESTVLWFKSRIEAKIPEVKLKTKAVTISKGTKTKPNCYAFHLSCSSYKGYLEVSYLVREIRAARTKKLAHFPSGRDLISSASSLVRNFFKWKV